MKPVRDTNSEPGLPVYLFALEQHDLHKKAGRVVSKQGHLKPNFHLQL